MKDPWPKRENDDANDRGTTLRHQIFMNVCGNDLFLYSVVILCNKSGASRPPAKFVRSQGFRFFCFMRSLFQSQDAAGRTLVFRKNLHAVTPQDVGKRVHCREPGIGFPLLDCLQDRKRNSRFGRELLLGQPREDATGGDQAS